MRRARFLKRSKTAASTEMSLNITSMADIFTILLVFLLKSYSVGALEITPSRGLQVPVATHSDTAESRLTLEIAQTSVQLDGEQLVTLHDFELPTGQELGPLAQALASKRAALTEQSQGKLLLIADSRAPYATLENVMRTAASQGFGDLKLAVVRAD
ncbi:MAG: ExbD/TolR family protein [Oligoflexia bacterium]